MKTFKGISLLAPGLAEKYRFFHLRRSLNGAGYDNPEDWHQPISDTFGQLPKADMRRVTIYKADGQTHSYSHHAQICKFRDQYVIAWSNGLKDEDEPGQEVRYLDGNSGEEQVSVEYTVNEIELSVGQAVPRDQLVVDEEEFW